MKDILQITGLDSRDSDLHEKQSGLGDGCSRLKEANETLQPRIRCGL